MSIRPTDAVSVAIARMLEENVGSVAVLDGATLVGIFTERDVLHLAAEGKRLGDLTVGDVMATFLVTLSPEDELLAVAYLMIDFRIRHLPVLEDGVVVGIVGIRDLLGVLAERLWGTHVAERRERVHKLLAREDRSPLRIGEAV